MKRPRVDSEPSCIFVFTHNDHSGTLSFITYYLLKNPDVMRKLRDEVDRVVGDRQIQAEHLTNLPYLTGLLLPV